MMKKITLFLFLLAVSIGYSQTVLENFEGTPPTLGFSNGSGSATIVTDPENGGTRGNVMQIITAAAQAPWQQGELTLQGDLMDLTTNKVVTVEVYSTTAFDMLARVEPGAGSGPIGATDASHTGSGWETLTFNFNVPKDNQAVANGLYEKIFFFNLWNKTTGGWAYNNNESVVTTSYVDNITAVAAARPETCNDGIMNNGETGVDCGGPNCNACPTPPTTAPPTPPARNAGDVVSIYGEAYARNVEVVAGNFDAGWCGSNSVTEVTIAGNKVMQYNGNNCQGIVLANGINATSYTMMHVDVYIEGGVDVTSKVFNLKFVQQPGGAAKEYNFNAGSSPALVAGSWISIDVPVDLSIMTGFKEFGITADNLKNQVWYDNLYIYRAATASVDNNALLGFSMYPNPASNRLNISAKETIQNAEIFNVLGKKVMSLEINKSSDSIDISKLSSGIYLIKYDVNGTVGTAKFIKQ